eukprot:m.24627 g.24627  ORF g.24627 m.24627 type:complete len:574 (+) comp7626_c0_seq1:438-2159(+)
MALALLALLSSASLSRDAKDKPNVIMLFVDDLGYGDLGFNGHPTTHTPNIDKLAWGGKVLSSWYSGCPVCSGSRAALMTGRQFARVGVPGVFGPDVQTGLPLNETTIANQLKKADYATAIMGKWHLGQRAMFLPASRGFDYYLGIPYSDDMGSARATPCQNGQQPASSRITLHDWTESYEELGFYDAEEQKASKGDPGASLLPLVYQDKAAGNTTVLEQPLDFTHLAEKYNDYVVNFIKTHASAPFFLYMPFSHVHTTAGNQPEQQYAGCKFINSTKRGRFGDALAEADWIIGNVFDAVNESGISQNTLTFFTGDNGPWMVKGKSGGSEGLLTGITAMYWNTGKGSTWEGGMHEAGFAHWPGVIEPMTRSSEVVSSMDVLPTVSALAGVPLPEGVVYDGKDMTPILMDSTGTAKSAHEFLFFYGGCARNPDRSNPHKAAWPSAVRYGQYKAYWCTAPGLGGCDTSVYPNCVAKHYNNVPLLFNVWEDPSEAYPLTQNDTNWKPPPELVPVLDAIQKAHDAEIASFVTGVLVAPPPLPSEKQPDGSYAYAICCDRSKQCDCNGKPSQLANLTQV